MKKSEKKINSLSQDTFCLWVNTTGSENGSITLKIINISFVAINYILVN